MASDISQRLTKFAPVDIDVDDSLITPDLVPVLQKLIRAAEIVDGIYLRQVWTGNPELRSRLAADPQLSDALGYFDIMYGPWDRLASGEPFIGTTPRPPGASFYPSDMTREEFDRYVAAHPAERDALSGYFTVIAREGDRLVPVPYSQAYQPELEQAAQALEEAAELSTDPRLQSYLRLRAAAFRSNDYRDSDLAWLDLGDCPIEVVIGPYEVYTDELLGLKAAFEAFITIRDPEASGQLARISGLSQELERALPVEERHRNLQRGTTLPISVVYVVMTSGDTRAGVQTIAFNLPNDEGVRQERGYKLVLLRNVMQAKYDLILVPIARALLAQDQLEEMSFDAFLHGTLMHESAHGLGPGTIVLPDGTQTDVNRALRDLYSTIEEAKADTVGLFCSRYMIEHGHLDRSMEHSLYATFLGGFFRSVRFGATEAHGRANMIQFNFIMEQGGIEQTPDGRYRVNYDRIGGAVEALVEELLAIEGDGDYARARRLIDRYGSMPANMEGSLSQLASIPVDIRPRYPAAERIRAR